MTTIAFIGLGNMGGPMAANLVKAGTRVHRASTCAPTVSRQAQAERRRDGRPRRRRPSRKPKWSITMLPAGKHVLSVYGDIAPKAAKGTLFIDCSTIDVEARARRTAIARAGAG